MTEALSAPVPVPRTNPGSGLFAGLACLGDILLLRGWLSGHSTMAGAIVLHVCLALALGALAMAAERRFSQAVLVRVILLILFGPLGGPALMIATPAAPAARPRTTDAGAKAAASRTAATGGAGDLYDQIRQGRRHPLPQQPLRSFRDTFRTGTLHQQQEAIAAISRGYHADMRPALSAALASPVPALRVQAAAVYARLRGTHEARAKELLAPDRAGNPPSGRDLADECLRVAQSGFVDARTQERLRELSIRLAEPAPPPAPPPGPAPLRRRLRPALQPPPRLKRHACGGLG